MNNVYIKDYGTSSENSATPARSPNHSNVELTNSSNEIKTNTFTTIFTTSFNPVSQPWDIASNILRALL